MANAKTAKKSTKSTKSVKTIGKAEAAVSAEPTKAQLELAKAKEIITPMAKAGKSDDEMIIKLMQDGGFTAKQAIRYVNQSLEDLGVRMSNKDRQTAVNDMLLANDFAPSDWSEVVKSAEWISSELDATTDKQALGCIKKFAKENKIELPAKPRGAGRSGGTSFRVVSLAWMEENPTSTDAEFEKWVLSNEGRTMGDVRYYGRIFKTVRNMYEAGVASAS